MKKCSFFLCAFLILISTSQADRYVTSRKTPPRPKLPIVQILETSYLIEKSQQTLASVELVLQQAHDIAESSVCGSYSAEQRDQLYIQFQELLTLVDPMVAMSEFQGQSLLTADGRDIVIRFGRDTLRFEAADITLVGLNLEGASLPAFLPFEPTLLQQIPDRPSLITFPDNRPPVDPNVLREFLEQINARRTDPNFAIPILIPIVETSQPDPDDLVHTQIPPVNLYEIRKETFYRVEAAVRKIKQLKLQFAGYHNTLCKYLPYLEPDSTAEIGLGLEIVQASKAQAEYIKTVLERAADIADASINGSYSPQQRTIMNNEFEYCLGECTTAAAGVYYGMGIIDGQNQLTVNTLRQSLAFTGFDLTTAALGLDGDLHINTIENAQSALPYITPAIEVVQQTVNALAEYEQTLSGLLLYRQGTGPCQVRPPRPQPTPVQRPLQHPTARPVRLDIR